MFFKHVAVVSFAVAFLALGEGSIYAQNTTTGGTVSSGTSQNNSGVGTSGSGVSTTGETRSGTTGASDQGRITNADPRKGGRIGPDGSLPKPNVQDDPQHRCLAPSGVC